MVPAHRHPARARCAKGGVLIAACLLAVGCGRLGYEIQVTSGADASHPSDETAPAADGSPSLDRPVTPTDASVPQTTDRDGGPAADDAVPVAGDANPVPPDAREPDAPDIVAPDGSAATDGSGTAPDAQAACVVPPGEGNVIVGWRLDTPIASNRAPGFGAKAMDLHCAGASCPTFVNGRMLFQGAQWLQSDPTTLDPGTTFTVTLWLYREPVMPANEPSLFTKRLGTDFLNSFQVSLDLTGAVSFGAAEAGGAYAFTDPAFAIAPRRWTHVAATHNAGRLVLFVDGTRRAAINLGARAAFDNNPFVIGADLDGALPVDFFTGALANLTVYDAVLPNDAIVTLAQRSCAPP